MNHLKDGLGLVICLMVPLLTFTADATPRNIEWHNDCDVSVRLAVRYKSARGWETAFWSNFQPGAVSLLKDDDGTLLTTSNRIFAYYAESLGTDAKLYWRNQGERYKYEVDGRHLRFKKARFDKQDGNFTFRVNCDRYSEELLRSTVESKSTNNRTQIQIIYEDFMYAYIPAWYVLGIPVDYREYPHVYLVAINPENPGGHSYYADAGKARDGGGKGKGTRNCNRAEQLCATVRNAAAVLTRNKNRQTLFVNASFSDVVGRMVQFANRVNAADIPYSWSAENCASFVFSLLRQSFDVYENPRPLDPGDDIYVLGWDTDLDLNARIKRYSGGGGGSGGGLLHLR